MSHSACSLSTKEILLGPHVSDPYSRLPAMIAQAMASLDEISNGRTIISLGAGGSGFAELGVARTRPADTLREAVRIIKGFLARERFSFEGQVFKVSNVSLGFKTRSIPIYISSRSPQVLQVAGEVADGVVIGTYSSKQGISYALENVRKGAKRVGRALSDLDVVSWVYMSISKDGKSAIENVRPFVASAIYRTSERAHRHIGIPEELAKDIGNVFAREHDIYTTGGLKAGRLLTEETVRKFSVAGTPDQCLEQIREIAKLGINKVWILPLSFPGAHYVRPETFEVLVPFANEVMSKFA